MGEDASQIVECRRPNAAGCRATPAAAREPDFETGIQQRATLLSRTHRGTLNHSQEDKPTMTSRLRIARTRAAFAVAILAFASLSAAGCATQKDLLAMPGLADVSATGPKGKKCYDKCAHAEASCKHICPGTEGLCQEDCELDTKFCLRDCPELMNHNPDKIRLAD